jgi:hypothetical protein
MFSKFVQTFLSTDLKNVCLGLVRASCLALPVCLVLPGGPKKSGPMATIKHTHTNTVFSIDIIFSINKFGCKFG